MMDEGRTAVFGMFTGDDRIWMWLEFMANSNDKWSDATAGTKDFMTLFQLGDEDSDWAGVHFENTD